MSTDQCTIGECISTVIFSFHFPPNRYCSLHHIDQQLPIANLTQLLGLSIAYRDIITTNAELAKQSQEISNIYTVNYCKLELMD